MNPLRVLIRTYILMTYPLSRPARRADVKTDTPYAVWVRLGWAERSTHTQVILNVARRSPAAGVATLARERRCGTFVPNGTISSVPDGDTETDTAQQALR